MQCDGPTVWLNNKHKVVMWCDNMGLVSLIYLGWELCMVYITVLVPSLCVVSNDSGVYSVL